MRRIILLSIILVLLVSCDMRIKDQDGFYAWNFSRVPSDSVIVQSHESYMANDAIYKEGYFDRPVEIYNVLNHAIDVRITTLEPYEQYWIVIEANSKIVFE